MPTHTCTQLQELLFRPSRAGTQARARAQAQACTIFRPHASPRMSPHMRPIVVSPARIMHACAQNHVCLLTESRMPAHRIMHACADMPAHRITHACAQNHTCLLTELCMPACRITHACAQNHACLLGPACTPNHACPHTESRMPVRSIGGRHPHPVAACGTSL